MSVQKTASKSWVIMSQLCIRVWRAYLANLTQAELFTKAFVNCKRNIAELPYPMSFTKCIVFLSTYVSWLKQCKYSENASENACVKCKLYFFYIALFEFWLFPFEYPSRRNIKQIWLDEKYFGSDLGGEKVF